MSEGKWPAVERLKSPFIPSMIFAMWSVIPLAAVLAGVDSLGGFLAVALPAAILSVVLGLVLPLTRPTKDAASNWLIFLGYGVLLIFVASVLFVLT